MDRPCISEHSEERSSVSQENSRGKQSDKEVIKRTSGQTDKTLKTMKSNGENALSRLTTNPGMVIL